MRPLKFFTIVALMMTLASLSSCSKTPAKAPITNSSNNLVVVEIRLVPPPKVEYPASTENVEDYIDEPLHFIEDEK